MKNKAWSNKEIEILRKLRSENKTTPEIQRELARNGFDRSKEAIGCKLYKELENGNICNYIVNKKERPEVQPTREEQDYISFINAVKQMKGSIRIGDRVLGHKVLSITKHFIVVSFGTYKETYTWQDLYKKGVHERGGSIRKKKI